MYRCAVCDASPGPATVLVWTASKCPGAAHLSGGSSLKKRTPPPPPARSLLFPRSWAGVPFVLKAGKALNDKKAEIRVQMVRGRGDVSGVGCCGSRL